VGEAEAANLGEWDVVRLAAGATAPRRHVVDGLLQGARAGNDADLLAHVSGSTTSMIS
jgi:hypothetical protein